jgi:hypothetical protein
MGPGNMGAANLGDANPGAANPGADRPRPPPADLLLRPLARLLRPLVRLLIQSGITCPAFCDLVRGVYIDVAMNDLLTDKKSRTDSRVSLLTGVHRKELRRQRTPQPAPAEPEAISWSSALIARWLGSPATTDAAHAPLALPRTGPAPSFEALVASATSDVRPRTVLDAWLDQGIVTLDADDRVRLNVAAFLPQEGRAAQVFYFARNLHDHLAAAAANVVAAGPARFLDRSLHYDRLGADAAARLETAGREAAQAMLLDLNRTAIAIADADDAARAAADPAAAKPALRRVNVGVYVYLEDEPADDKPADGDG